MKWNFTPRDQTFVSIKSYRNEMKFHTLRDQTFINVRRHRAAFTKSLKCHRKSLFGWQESKVIMEYDSAEYHSAENKIGK